MRRPVLNNRFCLLAILLVLALLIFGCGDDQPGTKVEDKPVAPSPAEVASLNFDTTGFTDQQIADLIQIEKVMHESLIRWSHLDKSALYDGELQYVRDHYSFSEYLDFPRIKPANTDSVVGFRLTGGQFFGRDSVVIEEVITFRGSRGNIIEYENKGLLHYQNGRWVHPTVSRMWEQLEYDERVRLADSAAAAEEAEGFGN